MNYLSLALPVDVGTDIKIELRKLLISYRSSLFLWYFCIDLIYKISIVFM